MFEDTAAVVADSPAKKPKENGGEPEKPKENGSTSDLPNKENGGEPGEAAPKEDALSSGLKLFEAGKRHLIAMDVPQAAEALGEACGLLAGHYGKVAVLMDQVYFYYGRALLELARAEDGVIDGNLAGKPDEDDDDDEGDEEAGDDNPEDGEPAEEGVSADPASNGEKAKEVEGTSANPENNGEKEEVDEVEEAEDEAIEDPEDIAVDESKDSGEEPTNLQLSWQMFELARKCLKLHADKLRADNVPAENERRVLVDGMINSTYKHFAEISMHMQNYTKAVEFRRTSLRNAWENGEPCAIAEDLEDLAVALRLDGKFKEALESLREAIRVLKPELASLRKETDGDSTTTTGIKEVKDWMSKIRQNIKYTLNMKAAQEEKANVSKARAAAAATIPQSEAKPDVTPTAEPPSETPIQHAAGDDASMETN